MSLAFAEATPASSIALDIEGVTHRYDLDGRRDGKRYERAHRRVPW